jgi:type VI secretion system protein VasD
MSSRICRMVLLAGLGGVLLGCAPAIKIAQPKPVQLHIVVTADPHVNPDRLGRASPVVMRLYQLSGDGEFLAADFFPLYDNEAAALPRSLLFREERQVGPGETQTLDVELKQEARFIGVMAAYRSVEQIVWRAIVPARGKELDVTLSATGVQLVAQP